MVVVLYRFATRLPHPRGEVNFTTVAASAQQKYFAWGRWKRLREFFPERQAEVAKVCDWMRSRNQRGFDRVWAAARSDE
jgi:hypothetical protein